MPGYGLVVRLPERQTRLVAAVVRRADVPSSPERDRAAQERFCAAQLDDMVRRLNGRIGLSPTPYLRMAPGRGAGGRGRPGAVAGRAARAARTGRPAAARDTRPTSRPQAKERQRGG